MSNNKLNPATYLYNKLKLHPDFSYVKSNPYQSEVTFRWKGALGQFKVVFTAKMGVPWYELHHNNKHLTGNSFHGIVSKDEIVADMYHISKIPNSPVVLKRGGPQS